MATDIKPKFGAAGQTMTITLASLATSSTATVGRQTTLVDNSSNRYDRIHVQAKITTGTSPTASTGIFIYLIRGDGTTRTDNAGTSDAAFTAVSAECVYIINTSSTSSVAYIATFVIDNPGLEWGLAIAHNTAVNLHATSGNHAITWFGEYAEAA